MPLLIQYLLKLSVSLVLVWVFYQLILRRLTFYNSNRWYLLLYSLFCFIIPVINLTPVLQQNEWTHNQVVNFVPLVQTYTTQVEAVTQCPAPLAANGWSKWDWLLVVVAAGTLFYMCRFVVRYYSLLRMRRRAELISDGAIKIYQVNKAIIPFSFGNAVFINRNLHSETELQEIIRHELVHVRQKHTIDVLAAELICLLNWYNPFAWLLRRSIRQNLEFIADNKVLENGVDKKQYQYLLLKVIGNNHFNIAPSFNFSSLKKRITMMNKVKTTKVQLVKFLFLLPLVSVLLLAFRSAQQSQTFHTKVPGTKATINEERPLSTIPLITKAAKKTTPDEIKQPEVSLLLNAPITDSAPVKTTIFQRTELRDTGMAVAYPPLIIVDDKEWPLALSLDLLDPNQIAGATFLKEGEAIAKYGGKAIHGVVCITTKKVGDNTPPKKISLTGTLTKTSSNHKFFGADSIIVDGRAVVPKAVVKTEWVLTETVATETTLSTNKR